MNCVQIKDRTAVPPGLIQTLLVPESRFFSCNIDFTTDLPLSHGCKTLLICVDYFTKPKTLFMYKKIDKILIAVVIVQLFFTYIASCFGIP